MNSAIVTRFRRWARLWPVAGLIAVAFSGCGKKLEGPQPSVSGVAPQVACNTGLATEILVRGDALSPLNDALLRGRQLELPLVTLTREKDLTGAESAAAPIQVPDLPSNPSASDVSWQSQQSMSFWVCPEGTCPARTEYALLPGLYTVGLANRAGKSTTLASALTIVPPPVLSSVDHDLLCQDKENVLELLGDYFLRVDGKSLVVAIGDKVFVPSELLDCRALPAAGSVKLDACRRARVRVPTKTFPTGTYPVTVTGPIPAGCKSTQAVTVTFVPEPTVSRIVEDLACLSEGPRSFTLEGSNFLTIDGQLPLISLGPVNFPAAGASGCVALSGPASAVARCTSLTLTVPKAGLPPAVHAVRVTNPAPADCGSSPPINLAITAPPSVKAVVPDLACNEQGTLLLKVSGTGFLAIDGAPPEVTLTGPNAVSYVVPSADVRLASGCPSLAGPTEAVRSCVELELSIPPGKLTAPGAYVVHLTNPAPAGCSSSEATTVLIVPAPHLIAVQPARVCSAQAMVTLTATGTGFLTVGTSAPMVTFSSVGMPPLTVNAGITTTGCVPVAGSALGVQSCSTLTLPIAANALAADVAYRVTVTNPAGCATTEDVVVTGAAPPSISQVSPATLCAGGGTISLAGSGFEAGAIVQLGAQLSTGLSVFDAGTGASATFGAGVVGGPFDVTLSNPSACSAQAPQKVSVVQGPLLVFVEPRVAWNGMNTPLIVYAATVVAPVVKVQLVLAGSSNPPIDLAFAPAPGRPDRPIAVVPRNTPPGIYDVLLADQTGCPARLSGALTVTAATALILTGVSPSFGWTGSPTDISVSASNTPPSPGFGALPGVYLTPSATQTSVTRLRSVAVISPTGLTAEVPAGLPAGNYDLTVVNPDGSVGVRTMAFTVKVLPPPSVSAVSPGQISAGAAAQPITLLGSNFRGSATVVFRCVNPLGVTLADQSLAVSASTPTSITASVNTTLYPSGANCIAVVTNGDDQSTAEFSSVVVVNASANLTGFRAGPDMASPRRGLAAVAGALSQSSRFVYAIAGDDGAAAMSSVEVLPVDIFGIAGPAFFTQRYGLSVPRTQASAVRVGRFLYVAGGTASLASTGAALDTIERAVLLSPATAPDAPAIDLDVVPAVQGGLSNGTFYFRVAAVMGPTDPFNPDGEELPSDPVGLTLPPLAGYLAQVKLSWNAVPGAAGYRIYRTAANGAAGSETLIADQSPPLFVTCTSPTSCVDKGATQLSTLTPLRPGSTGRWTPLPQRLATARIGPGVTWARDPISPDKAHLYVFGGMNDGGVAQASYEYLTLTINADGGSQTASAFTAGPGTLTGARWRLRGFTVHPQDSEFVDGGTFVWAGSGSASNPATTIGTIDGARVLAGGALGAFTSSAMPAHAGYGAFSAGDYLYILGGQNGLADVQSATAELGAAPPPPAFVNFQSFTPGLTTPRVDLGATLQSGNFYSLGGSLPDAGVTRSTEFVLY